MFKETFNNRIHLGTLARNILQERIQSGLLLWIKYDRLADAPPEGINKDGNTRSVANTYRTVENDRGEKIYRR